MANDLMDYYQAGSELGGKLAQAMQKRRTDAIANELLSQKDGRVHSGGVAELQMMIKMEEAVSERELRAAQAKRAREPEKTRFFHEQTGGVTTIDPANGKATYQRPEGLPPVKPHAPVVDPVEMKRFADELSAFHARKGVLQKQIDKLYGAGKFGVPLAALPAATGFARTNADGAGDPAGETFTAKTPDGASFGGNWNDWVTLRGLQDQLSGLQEPKAPGAVQSSSTPAQTAPGGDPEFLKAMDWARSNPQDPRSAKILQAIGAAK